jgi:hypothetical protein
MYEIMINNGQETGTCACEEPGCPFHEEVTGHDRVLAMQHDAAMHAAAEGHRVREDVGWHKVVSPRSLTEF